MDRTLGPAYKRAGHSWKPLARDPFWTLVARDCAEADCVLVNSQGVRDSIVRHGVNPQRIRVLYLGVRLDFLGAKTDFRRSGKLNLLFTGSFIVRKGLLDLLELMDRLRNSNVDAVLNVVGDAEEAKKLLGNRLNREDLILHGFQPQESLGKFLAEADMYVFPTLAEGCAKSAMEALAAGLPVVTTPSCGLPGLPGRDWVSVPENQPDELCRAVLSLAGNEALRTQIGKAGTALVREGYSWEQYGRNLAALYNELDSGIFDSLERSHLPAGLM
jgi:glycosyltransferase involved in cell wall biosynthesis